MSKMKVIIVTKMIKDAQKSMYILKVAVNITVSGNHYNVDANAYYVILVCGSCSTYLMVRFEWLHV